LSPSPITIALSKGRLQDEALSRFAAAGIVVAGADAGAGAASRRLWLDERLGRFRFILVKPADVPTYVEHGVAEVGVAGGDVLLESRADLHAPLDLGFGRCRLCLAGPKGGAAAAPAGSRTLRVATKYPRATRDWFHGRGLPVDVIELLGSVELAPLLGLADRIVDVVDTGRTLAENGLEVLETVAECSARLVANRAAWQLRRRELRELVEALRRRGSGEGEHA
jgi:ATP phosphoribosyltransferase